jgi:hypothetical protein
LSLHTVDHTHPQKTSEKTSQPINGAARPAPATAAAALATAAPAKDTSSFVRAEVDPGGTAGWFASGCMAPGWQSSAPNAGSARHPGYQPGNHFPASSSCI